MSYSRNSMQAIRIRKALKLLRPEKPFMIIESSLEIPQEL